MAPTLGADGPHVPGPKRIVDKGPLWRRGQAADPLAPVVLVELPELLVLVELPVEDGVPEPSDPDAPEPEPSEPPLLGLFAAVDPGAEDCESVE